MNEKQKTTLLIVCFLGALGLVGSCYYTFYLAGAKLTSHEREIKNSQTALDEAKEKRDGLRKMLENKASVEAKRAKIEQITRRLPDSVDAPGFVNALVSVLRATGIIQQSVRPTAQQNRAQYTEIPYTIKAFGRYHEVGQFLTLIEQNPDRFMRVKTIKISNNLKRPSVHPINMVIGTFMFNNPPPPPKVEVVVEEEPVKGKAKAKGKKAAKKDE